MKVKRLNNLGNKMGLKGCRLSRLNSPCTETHVSGPYWKLDEFPFLIIGPVEITTLNPNTRARESASEIKGSDMPLLLPACLSVSGRTSLRSGWPNRDETYGGGTFISGTGPLRQCSAKKRQEIWSLSGATTEVVFLVSAFRDGN